MLSLKLQIVLIIISFLFMAYIINSLRNEIIDFKYTLIWFFLGIVLIVISVFPEIPVFIANFLGIGLTVNAIFLLAIFFILLILLVITIAISKSHVKTLRLTQEIAILKNKLEEITKRKN